EVRDRGQAVKRYPVVMGRGRGRKLRQDNASTPEGRYRLYNLQPRATFHRAYDVDYPNALDQVRYDLAQRKGLLPPETPIGSEIQIHGGGIHSNWTFGCVALRNEDMDELFSRPEIGVGTRVTLVGGELTREDLEAIDRADRDAIVRLLGSDDPQTLGEYQGTRGLPMTCQPDLRTQRALGLSPKG
ncbi:MAG: L,D-transpeptidase, partial [Candidatus Eremiobacterota bacterium]